MKAFRFLTPLLAILAAGCSGDTDSARVIQLFDRALTPSTRIEREQASAIPYASMGFEFEGSDQYLLILGTLTPSQAEWYAGETLMVRTRQGRVVRTAGLPYDLGGLDRTQTAQQVGTPVSLSVDFPDLGVFGAAGTCLERDAGAETITILGTALATRHIIEHCAFPSLDWRFDNEYWRDAATQYVWRSKQYIHPKSPALFLEVFRPEKNS